VLVDNLDVASLPLDVDPPLTGRVRARLNGRGSLSSPADGEATTTIEEMALTWNGQPIATDGPATIRYANQQLAIDRFVVRAQDSTVAVKGTLPIDPRSGEGAIDLDAQVNLSTLASYAPEQYGVKAQGRASLTGSVRGSLRAIDPDLVVSVDEGFVIASGAEPGLSNVGIRIEISNGELVLPTLQADWGTAHLKAKARLPFDLLPKDLPIELPRQSGPAQLQAAVTKLELQTLPGVPERLAGIVSVQADVSAPRPDLSALTGQVTFPDLQVRFDQLTLDQEGVSTIALQNGEARIERFDLAGSVGRLALGGRVGLAAPRPIEATAQGSFNIGAIAAFTDAVRAEGATTLELVASGTADAPSLTGFVELADASVSVDEPEIAAEGLAARIDLAGQRATLSRLDGRLNGGTLSGGGSVEMGSGPVPEVDLTLRLQDVALDTPMDLRSLSNADIQAATRDEQIVVSGQITVQEAGLTEDINLDTGIFALITAPRSLDLTEARSPLLERVRLNLDVDTASPIVVDNNLARAEISADVRVVGNPYETGLSGRLTLEEGSELLLNERRYEVERGIVTFIDERRIVPSLDLLIRTAARNYDITLEVAGTPGETETTLTSDPSLPEPDILALLVTGRTLDEMRGEEFEVAQSQVMSQLAGRAGSSLSRGLQQATGLSTVRLEPNLIASEADPGARLTVGQDLADDVRLIYSTDLVNSSDQIWVTEYDVTRQFVSRAVRQSDASYRFDFRHDLRFGGLPEPRRTERRARPRIASVSIEGDTAIGEADVRERFRLDPGDRYDFFQIRRGIQRLEERYRDRGRLESRIRLERTVREDAVDLVLRITPGPQVDLTFEGASLPRKVQRQVREIWHRGVFDSQRAGDAVSAIRDWLVGERYLDSTLEHTITDAGPDARRVVFRIAPGKRFERVELVFSGARGIEPTDLEDVIKDQKLGPKVFTAPRTVTNLLQRVYREQGYLAAEIDPPQYDFSGPRARAVLAVREGPQFTIRNVNASGNRVLARRELVAEVPLVSADPYFPAVAERSLARIRELYWQRGYNDVAIEYQLALDRTAGAVDVNFVITEGQRSIVRDIQVAGNDRTSERLAREQLDIEVGAPLDLAALGRSRRNLYDTRAFASVDVTREPIAGAVSTATNGSGQEEVPGSVAGDTPVRLNVAVREVQPFQLRYGAFYDTERHVGGIFDISNHNSLGNARVLGLRSRIDSQLREARLYLSQPSLRYFPLESIATLYYRAERNPETAETNPFNVDRFGVSIQQERQLRNRYV
jgi:outer membrane protein assembly factor BamA